MSNSPIFENRKHKHLTLDDRCIIQEDLVKGKTFREIGQRLGKDPSTVSKEVRRNLTRMRPKDFGKPRNICTKRQLERAPHPNYRQGRTYDDFQQYIKENPDVPVVEMDTVEGTRGTKKVLLTLYFRSSSLLLVFLLESKTQAAVLDKFNHLEELWGLKTFRKVFPVILTDNGSEFKDPKSLEFSPKVNEEQRSSTVTPIPPGKSQVWRNYMWKSGRSCPKAAALKSLHKHKSSWYETMLTA